jgi:hypothetical protein
MCCIVFRGETAEDGDNARCAGAKIQLGDFFKSAPNAVPVNPRPVTLTCIAKGETLPSGEKNPPGRVVRATAKGAFVFLDAEETLDARSEARAVLRDRAAAGLEEGQMPEPLDAGDFDLELMYQILQRAIREWDPETKKIGGPLFPTVDALRELVVVAEANRLWRAHNEYIESEHPSEAPPPATFRGSKGRGGAVAGSSRR